MPIITLEFDAILFDMDGTLVDSTQGLAGAWDNFSQTYPDINVQEILNTAHGVRTVENLKRYCGVEDPELLERETERFEQAIVDCSFKDGKQGIILLPGVHEIMEELEPARKLPSPRWAICTSATMKYASQALKIAGVPVPDVFVTSEDVKHGKPAPDPYLLGAERCGVKPENCIVFEDAPAGIRSGQAAGCRTLAVVTSHTHEQMTECEPTFLVKDLSQVSVKRTARGVQVIITTQ